MINSLSIKSIDVEKAFLESELKENIYVILPPGYKEVYEEEKTENMVGKLNKAIYGLVQASKEFYKTITTYLVGHCGYEISEVDPCVLKKKTKNGLILCGLYVDDVLMVGNINQIECEIKVIERRYKLRISDKVTEYVGCEMDKKGNEFTYINQDSSIR